MEEREKTDIARAGNRGGTDEKQNMSLTVTEISMEDEDDGIFMSWPEPEPGETDDTDGSPVTEDDKPSGDVDGDDDNPDYAFIRAKKSDNEEASGKKKKKKKKEPEKPASEEALSSVKYYKYTEKLKALMLRRVLPIVLVLVFVCAFVLYFFRLQHLTLDNLEGYAPEDVFRATGIRQNMFVFSISKYDLRKRLAMDFPYIQDIDVELDLPDTVHLVFTEDCALFYTHIYDEYFIISQSMRVLARCTDPAEIPADLKCITLPAVSYAVVGYDLQFFDTSYLDFLTAYLEKIRTFEFYPRVDAMDLSNRSYLSLSYEGRLTVELGSSDDIDTKLLFVKSMIESLSEGERGTITVIDNKKATFSPTPRTGPGS